MKRTYYALSYSFSTKENVNGSGVQYIGLTDDNNFITKKTIDHCAKMMADSHPDTNPSSFVLIGCSCLGLMTEDQFQNYNQIPS